MLDGRIDIQGTIKELREQNLLDFVTHETSEAESSTVVVASAEEAAAAVLPTAEGEATNDASAEPRKPKKMIKDEARATGNVKWPIYKTYLEAW